MGLAEWLISGVGTLMIGSVFGTIIFIVVMSKVSKRREAAREVYRKAYNAAHGEFLAAVVELNDAHKGVRDAEAYLTFQKRSGRPDEVARAEMELGLWEMTANDAFDKWEVARDNAWLAYEEALAIGAIDQGEVVDTRRPRPAAS